MTTNLRKRHSGTLGRTKLVGIVASAVLIAAVYVSYNANNSVPLQSTYRIYADVPDAQRLVPTDDVRIGGVRVGQVSAVQAEVTQAGTPFARLTLKLAAHEGPVPVDSRVAIESASVLGASYVDLMPGRSRRMLRGGARAPLGTTGRTVQVEDLLDMFNAGSRKGVQIVLANLADGVAGRGQEINATIAHLATLMTPLTMVARAVAAPSTGLGPFVTAADSFSGALAPVAESLATGFDVAARTFGAFVRSRAALGRSLQLLAPAELAATGALTRLDPALDQLSALSPDLQAATSSLRPTLAAVDVAVRAGVPAAVQLRPFSRRLQGVFASLERFDRGVLTIGAIRSVTRLLAPTQAALDVFLPAQTQCNILPLWADGLGGVFSALGSNNGGPLIAAVGITHTGAQNEILQNAKPSSNIGINYVPHETNAECESGNEPYAGKQLLNNPPGDQSRTTRSTGPPPGVTALAEKAGLLTGPGQPR